MKLEFFYAPTRDLAASLALYRDALGWQEAWREGESTVSLVLPGGAVQLMLDASDPEAAPGPMFVVDDVRRFDADRPDALRAAKELEAIPGGTVASYLDPSGNTIYVLDQLEESAGA